MPSKRDTTPKVGEAYWCQLAGASTCALFLIVHIGDEILCVRTWLPYLQDWDRSHIQVYPRASVKVLEEALQEHYPKES